MPGSGMMNGLRPVWAASGMDELTWMVHKGQWTLVVMNVDRGAGLDVELSAGATVPGLLPISIGLLAFGALAIAGGAGLQFAGLRRRVARAGQAIGPYRPASAMTDSGNQLPPKG